MELFFTEKFSPQQTEISLSLEESRHAYKVLRKRSGDMIDLTDGKGHLIRGEISGKSSGQLNVRIKEFREMPFPKANHITVALSIVRPNRMNWAVEKLTELSVEKIVPIICHYNTTRNFKSDHLRRISISALKQSQQFYLPKICEPIQFKKWLIETGKQNFLKFIAQPDGKTVNTVNFADNVNKNIFVVIGPEGGFKQEEADLAAKYYFQPLNLGQTILRTETAAVVAVAQLKLFLTS